MASPSVWSPSQANFDMKRKASYSLFSGQAPQARSCPPVPDPDAKGPGDKHQELWKLMQSYKANDSDAIKRDVVSHVEYSLACTRFSFSQADAYRAAALAVRDRLLESLNDTNAFYQDKDVKKAYYLSAEYLMGRFMQNALANLDIEAQFKDA